MVGPPPAPVGRQAGLRQSRSPPQSKATHRLYNQFLQWTTDGWCRALAGTPLNTLLGHPELAL